MGMTLEGLEFMILGWGVILALTIFSFVKVFRVEARKRKKNPE